MPYPLDSAPGQRFRLEQWAPYLSASGIHLDFLPFLDQSAMGMLYGPGRTTAKARAIVSGCVERLIWTIRKSRDYDAVVVFREAVLLGVDWIERLLARRVPLIFDFDDAIWLPNVSQANARFRWLKGFAKIDRILALSTAVSAGCEYLAHYARRHNRNVFVVPTSIELRQYSPPRTHREGDSLTLGWTGSVTTGPYLELIGNVLRRVAERIPLELVVFGATIDLPGIRTRCQPWSAQAEVETIRGFDVGLKPLPQEDWVRGKCPMKELQYMSLGVPVVATRFGTTSEAVQHGLNGFLCSTDDEWIDALLALRDPTLRQRMGACGRETVEGRYASSRAASLFAEVLRVAVGRAAETRR